MRSSGVIGSLRRRGWIDFCSDPWSEAASRTRLVQRRGRDAVHGVERAEAGGENRTCGDDAGDGR